MMALFQTKSIDKRDDLNIDIVNFSFLDEDISYRIISAHCAQFAFHYENTPMLYIGFSTVVKVDIFLIFAQNIDCFPKIYVLEQK